MKKYSVLMSLYHKERPEYFRVAVESMLAQTVTPDEIVIVKDGPITAALEAVLVELCDQNTELFQIVTIEKNVGLGLALSQGLLICRNELVARMDTDDYSRPDRCEKQLAIFELQSELSLVGGNISEFIDDIDSSVGKRVVPEKNEQIVEYMKTRCPFNHVTVMFRKSAVLKAGNYHHWPFNEDYDLWLRMMQAGMIFYNLQDILVDVRVGADMYQRRGGDIYFQSEVKLQKFMLEQHIINRKLYLLNVTKRFIVQRLLPSGLRGWVFQVFAREK